MDFRIVDILTKGDRGKAEVSQALGQKEVSGPLNQAIRRMLKEGIIERTIPDSDPRLRAAAQSGFPESICWEHGGLPRDFCCLLAPPGKAFVQQGQTVVTHGGISLDEVIVPFVEISRGKAVY